MAFLLCVRMSAKTVSSNAVDLHSIGALETFEREISKKDYRWTAQLWGR